MLDLVVIGHLSRDLLVTPTVRRETLGGGTAYAMIAPAIGIQKSGIVSKVGADFDKEYLDCLRQSDLVLDGLHFDGPRTTRFVNVYDAEDRRQQYVEALAPPILLEDLPSSTFTAKVVHFCPLSTHDLDLKIFSTIKQEHNIVSLDAQGFLREVRGQRVFPRPWHELPDIVSSLDVIKFDEYEIHSALPGLSETEAVSKLFDMGIRLVVVTRERHGSSIYSPAERIDIPAIPPKRVLDNTGCGDTYIIGFLLEYLRTADLRRAGLFAASCASLNLEFIGPYSMPDRDAVLARMADFL